MGINTPAQVIGKVVDIGRQKALLTDMRLGKAILSSAMAGAFIALGGLLALVVGQGFPGISGCNPALARLLSGCMFPVGLILVVFMGTELFTGNNAVLIPGAARGEISYTQVLRNWVIVYLGNMIGAVGFTVLFAWLAGITDGELYSTAAVRIATGKVELGWWTVLVRGIGANALVCLAIWLGLSCNSPLGRMVGLWMPVMAFVVLGMEHSIANMFYLPLGMLHGATFGIGDAVWHNLVPATLGNIMGGALFVGMAMNYLHGQSSAPAGKY